MSVTTSSMEEMFARIFQMTLRREMMSFENKFMGQLQQNQTEIMLAIKELKTPHNSNRLGGLHPEQHNLAGGCPPEVSKDLLQSHIRGAGTNERPKSLDDTPLVKNQKRTSTSTATTASINVKQKLSKPRVTCVIDLVDEDDEVPPKILPPVASKDIEEPSAKGARTRQVGCNTDVARPVPPAPAVVSPVPPAPAVVPPAPAVVPPVPPAPAVVPPVPPAPAVVPPVPPAPAVVPPAPAVVPPVPAVLPPVPPAPAVLHPVQVVHVAVPRGPAVPRVIFAPKVSAAPVVAPRATSNGIIPKKRRRTESASTSGAMATVHSPQNPGAVPKGSPDLPNVISPSGARGSSPPPTPVDILAKTEKEEILSMSHEVAQIASWEPVEVGYTMRGKNIEAISRGILASDGFPYTVTLAIEFANLLDVALTDPKGYFACGGVSGIVRADVLPLSVECLTLHDNKLPDHGVSGLITYKIDLTNLRLVIAFDVAKVGKTCFGAAFMPADVEVNDVLDDYVWNVVRPEEMRTDIRCSRFSREPKCVFAKFGNYIARVAITPGPKAVFKVIVVKTLDFVRADLEEKLMQIVLQGTNNSKLPSPSLSKPGNDIQIINLLNVFLVNPKRYLPKEAPHKEDMLIMIQPMSCTSFSTLNLRYSEQIFSYRIDTTDLRLAVTCCTKSCEGSFAIGFIPHHVPMDTELISSLKKPDQWVTRPDRKCGLAKDGELKIEKRNIRARVTMTEEPNVTLKVVISTF